MAIKDDGGRAFPSIERVEEYSADLGVYVKHTITNGGMTLRDHFAAQALAGGIHEFLAAGDAWSSYDDFARTCWRMADAMLAERSKA